MKPFVFSFILLLLGQQLRAQASPELKPDLNKLNSLLRREKKIEPVRLYEPFHQAADTALLVSVSSGGTVYRLPQDGMPCFRSDNSLYISKMPVVRLRPQAQIPNALTSKPLVWQSLPKP